MVEAAEKRASEAEARAAATEARAAQLEMQLAAALARIAVLEEENKKLRAQLGQDSSNSSRPPSSDPPGAKAENRKKKRKARKRSGRKAGGQLGHRGRTRPLRPVEEADEVRHHHPDECEHCGHGLGEKDEAGPPVPHQQYELPPLVLLLIHNWLHRRSCPGCGKTTVAGLPDGESTSGQGPRLTAFIGLLTAHNRQSRRLVSDLLYDLFDLRISIGTEQACWERLGQALAKPNEELEHALVEADSLHMDETGWRQWGQAVLAVCGDHRGIHPVHGPPTARRRRAAAVVPRWVRRDHPQRSLVRLQLLRPGEAPALLVPPGPRPPGHHRRQGGGIGVGHSDPQGEKRMFRAWHEYLDGKTTWQGLQEAVAPFRQQFHRFCVDGNAQDADDLWRKLGKSLLKLWPAVFRFIDVEGLEPTNNFAEQAVRPSVILRKLSQGTRSDMGSLCIARVMSVTATCRKQGLDILDYMTEALAAHWHGIPPPPLLMRS